MSPAAVKLVAKLRKTRAAIAAHTSRGRGLGEGGRINNRGCGLCDRYDNERTALLALDWQAWRDYCASTGSSAAHTGHDLFA